MTRANIVIITGQGKFNFQSNSSAYPSLMMEPIIKFVGSTASRNAIFKGNLDFYDNPDSFALSELIDKCGLTLGRIGNFSYHYEIDFVLKHIKVWDNNLRWVNAPSDWRERGYNCWENEKGKYGWTNWVKDKLLYSKRFDELVVGVNDYDPVFADNIFEEAEKIAR